MSRPEIAMPHAAPTCHWSDAGEREHFLQFYQDDAFLLRSVSGCVASGLRSGSAAVVIATTAHLQELERQWREMGVGLDAARACGLYTSLGAEETLSKLLLGEWPQARRFADVVEPIVAAAAAQFPHVIAFGEMAGLLWSEGKHHAAIHLEELWNDFARRHCFTLYCSCPIHAGSQAPAERHRELCSAHSRAIPAERYAELESPAERLAEICTLQHKAASLESEIHERRRLERDLQQKVEQLMETERRRNEFLAALAHELRNPLAPIRSAAELMHLDQANGATVSTARVIIERQVEQLAHLIDDLMDVSRVMHGAIELRKAHVDVQEIVRVAVRMTRPAIAGKEHHLEVSVPPERMLVNGDAARLAQVVAHLLNNAAKYSKASSCIRVCVTREDDHAAIRVSDTGIGMANELLPHIFDTFTHGRGSASSVRDGLGLGLTLAKHLVELHDGVIEADSEGPNQGSTFTVRLPLVATSGNVPSSCRAATNETSSAFRAGRRVLIADDNRDSATILALLLESQDCEVRTANDGAEALRIAAEFRPEIVLLDIGMPGLDGYETARRLRASSWGRHIALYAITGWGQAEDKHQARQAGFDRHLTKPVQLETLIQLVATVGRTG